MTLNNRTVQSILDSSSIFFSNYGDKTKALGATSIVNDLNILHFLGYEIIPENDLVFDRLSLHQKGLKSEAFL